MAEQNTIGRFLIIATVLMGILAAISWMGVATTSDENAASAEQTMADALAGVKCRQHGASSAACAEARFEARGVDEDEGGFETHIMLTTITIGGVAAYGAWRLATKEGN